MAAAEITLCYVHGSSIGYGRYGVELAAALTRSGLDVYDDLENSPKTMDPRWETGERRHKLTNVVAWASTPTHARGWWSDQVTVLSTMWESQRLPESFRETLHHFDTLIVPSDQNVELFSRYHPNVKKVALGIDPKRWSFRPRKKGGARFNFLIGGSGLRKGTDLAYRAFRKVFPEGSWGDGPEPWLIFKSKRPEDFWGPRIERVGGTISDDAEVELYANAHCYLQPSRGEGFGLQPLQAIAQGCPTILTNAHGHTDFAWLGHGLDTTPSQSAYFIFGDAGQWWEPDFDQLCDAMRWVYDNYDAATAGAESAGAVARTTFSWVNTATGFRQAIGEDRLRTPYQGDKTWIEPQPRLYRVRVTKPWRAEVAGSQYHLRPGEDTWELADIKRVLFEADLLDPDCLVEREANDVTGLSPEQVEAIGGYSARHAYCEGCGQKLGSGITKADEIYAELEAAAS